MNSTDMSQFLDVFLDEGREQLALLEANILEMERGNHTTEMLQVLFRAAHTLKGSSRAMGFLAIGDLTHEMENILDDLRNDLLEVSTPIVNALLDCLDSLGALIDSVASAGTDEGSADGSIPELVSRLNALRSESEPQVMNSAPAAFPAAAFTLASFELESATAALDSGLNVYEIKMVLSAECVMKSVRVWMALGALEPLGSILASNPSEEKLEAEDFDLTFSLIIATESGRTVIEAALAGVSEVDSCVVAEWKADSVPTAIVPQPELTPVPASIEEKVVADVPTQTAPLAEKQANAPAAAPQSQTIRVEVSRLDNLLNLVGELVIERSQVRRLCSDLHAKYPRDENAAQLVESTHRIARVTAELQDQIMKARMLPIDGVFQRMPRMIRDLAQKTGKDVRFEMSGGETELDRTVLESLGDPLIHLLRNSVDHGVETPESRLSAGKPKNGLVKLSARHEENHIVIEISDDGKGMDPEKLKQSAIRKGLISEIQAKAMTEKDALNIIFASGFSTAEALSDISGRGVGMDIVKSSLEKVGGRVLVDSTLGKGSCFTIHLPLTLAIVRAVLVEAGGGIYVLPLGNVVEMLRIGKMDGQIQRRTLGGQAIINLRGRTIPIASLSDLLSGSHVIGAAKKPGKDNFVVIVGVGERQVGLCVDSLIGEQEVVIKSMGMLLGDIAGLAGATILGDGKVALIVDAARVSERMRPQSRLGKDVEVVS